MRLLLPLTALLLVGCPGPTTPPDASVEPPDAGPADAGIDAGQPRPDAGLPDAGFTAAPVSQWCQLVAQAQCFRDLRCQRVTPARWDACLARKQDTCDQDAYANAATQGRLDYDEDAGLRCLNGYAVGSCVEVPEDCGAAFTGRVPPDGGCILNDECGATGFCYQYDAVCPHRCRGWTAEGGRCDSFSTQCDPSIHVCARDGGANECQPRRAVDAGCVNYSDCGVGLACITGQCIEVRADGGEPCAVRSGYPFCTTEFFCRQELDAMGTLKPGTCQLRSGLGGACTGNADCLPSLRCTSIITTGFCVPKVAPDGNCTSYDDCEDGLFCNQGQRCQVFPSDGGDCSDQGSFYRCDTGQFCAFAAVGDLDTCEPRRAVGDGCSYDGMCLSQECEFGTLVDGGFGGSCVARCSQRADGGF